MLGEFPYRVLDDATAAELHAQTALVNHSLTIASRTANAVGTSVAWALDNLRPEIFEAWLLSEFGWTVSVGESFLYATPGFKGTTEREKIVAAAHLSASLAAQSVAARELTRAKKLIEAYRLILKGDDAAKGMTVRRPRRSRIRVLRSRVRKNDLDSDDLIG